MEYLRAFQSELLKIRRTWAFTLSIAAPASVTLFVFFIALMLPNQAWNDVWLYYLRGVAGSWLLLMIPFYVALLYALLASTDHNASAWKLLLSQPISRSPLYIAKLGTGVMLVAWSEMVLAGLCLATGSLLPRLRPRLGGYGSGVELNHFLAMLAAGFGSALLIMAIHAWLSIRSSNFALSLGVAAFAVMPNVFGLRQAATQKYWPWLFPFDVLQTFGVQGRDKIQPFWSVGHLVVVSSLGAVAVTAMALWDFSRREIT